MIVEFIGIGLMAVVGGWLTGLSYFTKVNKRYKRMWEESSRVIDSLSVDELVDGKNRQRELHALPPSPSYVIDTSALEAAAHSKGYERGVRETCLSHGPQLERAKAAGYSDGYKAAMREVREIHKHDSSLVPPVPQSPRFETSPPSGTYWLNGASGIVRGGYNHLCCQGTNGCNFIGNYPHTCSLFHQ